MLFFCNSLNKVFRYIKTSTYSVLVHLFLFNYDFSFLQRLNKQICETISIIICKLINISSITEGAKTYATACVNLAWYLKHKNKYDSKQVTIQNVFILVKSYSNYLRQIQFLKIWLYKFLHILVQFWFFAHFQLDNKNHL